jgi:hypothetical protein
MVAASAVVATLFAGTTISSHRSVASAAAARLGALPLAFEPNVGQTNRPVRFLARAGRSTLFVTRSRVVLALRRGARGEVVAVRFPGADPARISAERRLPGVSNYLVGSDPARWRTHVPQFGAVRYTRLYPGVDLVLHGARDARIEYDLRVSPGADPSRIRLTFDGPRALRIAPDLALVLSLRRGEIRQPRPLAWQTVAGVRKPVSVSYELVGRTVRFRLGAYDRSRALVIDPKVVYASYWGGSGNEGCDPTPDPAGNMYVTCGTDSPNLPTLNAIQPHRGGEDVYIAKLDRSGTKILYSTYLGSAGGDDEGDSIAVNPQGEAYVSGFASGPDFPTTSGAYDTTFNGGSLPGCVCFGDVFVAKLSADGSRLLYSTFVGGSAAEQTNTLALDHDGSVVITGFTGSSDFPTTPGAVKSTFGGGTARFEDVPTDAFAAKLDPSGSRLVYSTYLGGSGDDAGKGVALDDAGDAYYTGFTQSPEFPTTPGALKTSFAAGTLLNGYVTKLDRSGRVVWSTYLGGPTRDSGWGIDVDSRRDVYVSGSSIGGFPVTAGAAQGTFGGVRDWFVAKLDRSGSSLDWATYLGGSDFDGLGPTLRVDRQGNADVVGPTLSTDFPTTADAFQAANAGGFDLGIVQLDRTGRLVFSSYLGGSSDEDNGASNPALDNEGNFYIGGVSSSPDFPVTPNAIQPAYGGGEIDGLLVKVAFGHGH